jgi:glycosyltransferase involved in cell wall biosynthesis
MDESKNERVLFVYWGRRGSLSWLALELTKWLASRPDIAAKISISRSNELWPKFTRFADHVFEVETFGAALGAVTHLPRFILQARHLVRTLKAERYRAVIVLLPHVWTPLFGRMVRRAGIRYLVVAHDADPHPGDRTARVHRWLMQDVRHADKVVVLSQAVRNRLIEARRIEPQKIATLFHPIYMSSPVAAQAHPHRPFRFIFFGRIAAYKGLDLLLDACERLRRDGAQFSLSVVGEGPLGNYAARLGALAATVINRWIPHADVPAVLADCDAVVLPYAEASQSGVAALAMGQAIPAIVTPVGGLAEQVEHGKTGLVTQSVSAEALREAMRSLIDDKALYDSIRENLQRVRGERSMYRFAAGLMQLALADVP